MALVQVGMSVLCEIPSLSVSSPSAAKPLTIFTSRHNEPYPPPVPPLPPSVILKTPSNPNPGYKAQEELTRPSHGPVSPPRTKPDDTGNSQNKKEFFPIAWRVIGGGVRVGNPNSRVGAETFGDCTSSESQFAASSELAPSDAEGELVWIRTLCAL